MNLQAVDRLYQALSFETRRYLQDVTNEFPFLMGFDGDLQKFSDLIEIFCKKGDPPIVLRKPFLPKTQSDELFIMEFKRLVSQTNDELLKMRRKKKYNGMQIAVFQEEFTHYCYGRGPRF